MTTLHLCKKLQRLAVHLNFHKIVMLDNVRSSALHSDRSELLPWTPYGAAAPHLFSVPFQTQKLSLQRSQSRSYLELEFH